MGLGNPGPRYADTRHNVGFAVVDAFAARHRVAFEPRYRGRFGRAQVGDAAIALLEPETYMNRSGDAVVPALDDLGLGPSDLLVVYDDLDLPFGRLRLRPNGGAGGHNGLGDILAQLDTREVPRLRFGLGRPPAGEDPVEFVLRPFDAAEREDLASCVAAAADAVEAVIREGVTAAMNSVNRETPDDANPETK